MVPMAVVQLPAPSVLDLTFGTDISLKAQLLLRSRTRRRRTRPITGRDHDHDRVLQAHLQKSDGVRREGRGQQNSDRGRCNGSELAAAGKKFSPIFEFRIHLRRRSIARIAHGSFAPLSPAPTTTV